MANRLWLRLLEAKALDETGKGWEIGSDDIYLGAVQIDARGTPHRVDPFYVGEFDDDDVVRWNRSEEPNGKWWLSWPLSGDAADYPSLHVAYVVMIERDGGREIDDYMDRLVERTKDTWSFMRHGAKADSATKAKVVTEAAKIVKDIGKEIYKEVKGAVRPDDIFDPELLDLELPDPGHRFDGDKNNSPDRTMEFKGHNGKYRVRYDWVRTTADPPHSPPG